jgi:hypothetical protein
MIRTGISFFCWVVAVVAAVITVPTLWVATHVANEDGYVDFTRPFVADTELRNALVAEIADEIVSRGGLPTVTTRPVVIATLGTVARRMAQEPGFAKAWEKSQRRTHRLTFGPEAETDRLTADIGPIAAFVVKRATKNLPLSVTVPDTLEVPIYDAPAREVLDQVEKAPSRSRIGLLVVGLASVLCIGFARRRINAIVALSAGAVLTGGVLLVVTGLALPEVLGRTPARTPFARQMRDLLVDRASNSLDQWLLGIVVVGGVALVIAGLGRALPRR